MAAAAPGGERSTPAPRGTPGPSLTGPRKDTAKTKYLALTLAKSATMPTPAPFETSMLTLQFDTTFELLLQQDTSRLRSLVTSKAYRGQAAVAINQMSALQYKMPAGRYSPKQFQIAQFSRPWVEPFPRSLTVPIDEFDLLNSIANPQGVITMAAVAAANRLYDDTIIASAFGTTQRGEDKSAWTAETFPSTASTSTSSTAPYGGFLVADTFGSGASVGATFNKIREMRRVLRHYENNLDAESVTLVAGSQQESDFLGQIEVVDGNMRVGARMENGSPTAILGTNIVYSERLQTSSSNSLRNCIGFVRSGLHLGIWLDVKTTIDRREDLESDPLQLYSMIQLGACRTQLGKVIQVNCADTTGVDITP